MDTDTISDVTLKNVAMSGMAYGSKKDSNMNNNKRNAHMKPLYITLTISNAIRTRLLHSNFAGFLCSKRNKLPLQ